MFGRDDKKGPDLGKVQEAVGAAGSAGVRNLSVRQNGNVIEIHGQADNLSEKQQAFRTITDRVGDAAGVVNFIQVAQEPTRPGGMTSASADVNTLGPLPGSTQQGRTHTVAKGETLSHLAQRYYGKASDYQRIFQANRDVLSDADKIREGMQLRIP